MMQKWEYKRFLKTWVNPPCGNDDVQWFNELGQEGWEVIEFKEHDRVRDGSLLVTSVALCKRPIVATLTYTLDNDGLRLVFAQAEDEARQLSEFMTNG